MLTEDIGLKLLGRSPTGRLFMPVVQIISLDIPEGAIFGAHLLHFLRICEF
jgi:hypothetical protein